MWCWFSGCCVVVVVVVGVTLLQWVLCVVGCVLGVVCEYEML